MTKAFDTSDLVARLKAAGIPILDDAGKKVVGCVLGWVNDSLVLEVASQPLFAIAVPLVAQLLPVVDSAIDKALGVVPPPAGS